MNVAQSAAVKSRIFKFIFILVFFFIPQVSYSYTCKDLFQERHTSLPLKVTPQVREFVRLASEPNGMNQIYRQNFLNIQNKLKKELSRSSLIITKILFGLQTKLRYRLMQALLQRIESKIESKSFKSFDQIVLTSIALELIHNEYETFRTIYREEDLTKELNQIENPQQQLDFLIKTRMSEASTFLAGIKENRLEMVLSLTDAWRVVPVEFTLSPEDILYLNMNGLAPLWVAEKSYKVDSVKLSPAQLFTHDLIHYLKQVMVLKNYKTEINTERLKLINNIIRKLLSEDTEIIEVSAAFYITHELVNGNNVLDFQNNPSLYSDRFSNPDDLGFLFKEYNKKTGKDLVSFLTELADVIKKRLTEADLVGLE